MLGESGEISYTYVGGSVHPNPHSRTRDPDVKSIDRRWLIYVGVMMRGFKSEWYS